MATKITHIVNATTTSSTTPVSAREKLENYPIVVALYTDMENTIMEVHSHPYYEIILPLSGMVRYASGGNLYDLCAGDLILIPNEIYHTFHLDMTPSAYERIIVKIDADFWEERCHELHVEDALLKKEILLLRSGSISQWNLRTLFERMNKSTELEGFHQEIAFRSQLSEFMMILDQTIEENLVAAPNVLNSLATKALEYIETHFKDPSLNVRQVSEYTYVSREHLSRIFKEYTGQSVHVYITSLRMQAFREALAEGQNILTACSDCGFSDYSTFNRSFRKLYGMSPAEYRDRLKRQPDQP
ncbi:MAG: AraC family transcriptional regulator [Lachnospiraceae bacterium]|nr:AraC family transcriptional regulator [Lachnospiraceae bacterium]